MDDNFYKVLKLVQKIKETSEATIQDFYNGHIDLEFVKGCVINSDCILDDIEELWDLDLTEYRTNLNFTKNTNK